MEALIILFLCGEPSSIHHYHNGIKARYEASELPYHKIWKMIEMQPRDTNGNYIIRKIETSDDRPGECA